MSLTTKSPRAVALAALAVGKDALAEYAHRFSPKVFTQPQLFACLALMTFFRTDYRGIEQYLHDFKDLQRWLDLKRVPDQSTLHKAARRLLGAEPALALLHATVRLMMHPRNTPRPRKPRPRKIVRRAAADSTGLESGHRSPYFVRRRERGRPRNQAGNPLYQTTTYTRFPKLSLLIDCGTHQALTMLVGRGPGSDARGLAGLLADVHRVAVIDTLLADAGYDSEANHVLCREDHGIRSVIPPRIGRPTAKPPSGLYRRLMRRRFPKRIYGQRWQVETTHSMIKRNLTDELSARGYHPQCRQMRLLVITHNLMILILGGEVFDGAYFSPFPILFPSPKILLPSLFPTLPFCYLPIGM